MTEPTWLQRIRQQIDRAKVKRRLKAALRRKPRPARVIPPKEQG